MGWCDSIKCVMMFEKFKKVDASIYRNKAIKIVKLCEGISGVPDRAFFTRRWERWEHNDG